jgi:hypothetical protein
MGGRQVDQVQVDRYRKPASHSLPWEFKNSIIRKHRNKRDNSYHVHAFLVPLNLKAEDQGLCHAVYRGVAYDLTDFIEKHPAGSWLINLSLGRDCTALFESYHLRPDVAVARLKMLPTIPDFPVAAVPVAPRPNDSDLYNTIRERVRTEIFKGQVRRFPTLPCPSLQTYYGE